MGRNVLKPMERVTPSSVPGESLAKRSQEFVTNDLAARGHPSPLRSGAPSCSGQSFRFHLAPHLLRTLRWGL